MQAKSGHSSLSCHVKGPSVVGCHEAQCYHRFYFIHATLPGLGIPLHVRVGDTAGFPPPRGCVTRPKDQSQFLKSVFPARRCLTSEPRSWQLRHADCGRRGLETQERTGGGGHPGIGSPNHTEAQADAERQPLRDTEGEETHGTDGNSEIHRGTGKTWEDAGASGGHHRGMGEYLGDTERHRNPCIWDSLTGKPALRTDVVKPHQ
ncbi:hypothetical protein NDU88_000512 [Pleurodeles waltl]|uniref:Uncharacterized protein n=1 Tax=Pleurodeles waltl TaxID=8319 RepID=A0AAV7S9R5_PLEWA|nr:hypothetical protein NDU88_000512 [Pleurodeles waltl]